CWRDFAANEGGGVIDLIVRVRQCTRRSALEWLAETAGIPLQTWTPEQKRAYARLVPAAETLAINIADYSTGKRIILQGLLEDLKAVARWALEIDSEATYDQLDQLAGPVRSAIAEIAGATPDALARAYTVALKEDPAQAEELRRLGLHART